MSLILFWLLNPINDISTALPPVLFEPISEMELASKNQYNEKFPEIQNKLHAEVKPLELRDTTKSAVFEKIHKIAGNYKSWDLLLVDKERFIIQGTDTTSVMNFTDDFVIRVQDGQNGDVVVHMRSRSRVGRSDLGKNADRIVQFLKQVSEM